MMHKIKSNKIISYLLLILCIIIILNPSIYAKACLKGISVWSVNVLPVLFPFFVFTQLITALSTPNDNVVDRLFNRVYNTPKGSLSTFLLSALAGYPMGVKLISNMHSKKYISTNDAQKMLSFCSISSPMFMIGTVGVMMLKNYTAGIIILISNIIGSLLNGLIYRGRKTNQPSPQKSECNRNNLLSDTIYNSLISILVVGCYIVLSFLLIEILKNLHIFSILSKTICVVFQCEQYQNIVQSVLVGFLEITTGILDISINPAHIAVKTILSSGLIGFGGLSIFLQSLNFMSNLKIKRKVILIQKFTQCIFCLLISSLLCLIFF